MEFLYELDLFWNKLFCDSFHLLYEHNEISPIKDSSYHGDIKKNLFNKISKKKTHTTIQTVYFPAKCKIKDGPSFDNVFSFFLLINHELINQLTSKEREMAHPVCIRIERNNSYACENSLEL